MRVLDNAVQVAVAIAVLLVSERFPELAFGKLLYQVGKGFGFGPDGGQEISPIGLRGNGRMGEAISVFGYERLALKHLQHAVYIVVRVVHQRGDGVKTVHLRGSLLPGYIGQLLFQGNAGPVAAKVQVAEMFGYLGWEMHGF